MDNQIIPQDQQVIDPNQPQDPGYKYGDLQKETIRDIASNTEEPKEVKPEEKPTEEPEVPLEEVGKKIAEDTANAILEKQKNDALEAEKARLAEEEKNKPVEAKEKEYLDWEEQFKKDNNRQPNYIEALTFVKDQAIKDINSAQEQAKQEAEAKQAETLKQQQEDDKRINAVIDDELADLYKANKLTAIKDPNNPSDQGVIERKALFQQWAEVNTTRRANGQPDIISPTRIYEFYYKKPSAQPAGAQAPIAGNKGSAVAPSNEESYTYQDLKKPWSWFRRG